MGSGIWDTPVYPQDATVMSYFKLHCKFKFINLYLDHIRILDEIICKICIQYCMQILYANIAYLLNNCMQILHTSLIINNDCWAYELNTNIQSLVLFLSYNHIFVMLFLSCNQEHIYFLSGTYLIIFQDCTCDDE